MIRLSISAWMLAGLVTLITQPGWLVLWVALPLVVVPLLLLHWLISPR